MHAKPMLKKIAEGYGYSYFLQKYLRRSQSFVLTWKPYVIHKGTTKPI